MTKEVSIPTEWGLSNLPCNEKLTKLAGHTLQAVNDAYMTRGGREKQEEVIVKFFRAYRNAITSSDFSDEIADEVVREAIINFAIEVGESVEISQHHVIGLWAESRS